MIDDKYPVKSHFIPKQDYVEVDESKDSTSLLELLKQIIKPKPQIKFIHLSNPDFYPAYISERENKQPGISKEIDLLNKKGSPHGLPFSTTATPPTTARLIDNERTCLLFNQSRHTACLQQAGRTSKVIPCTPVLLYQHHFSGFS